MKITSIKGLHLYDGHFRSPRRVSVLKSSIVYYISYHIAKSCLCRLYIAWGSYLAEFFLLFFTLHAHTLLQSFLVQLEGTYPNKERWVKKIIRKYIRGKRSLQRAQKNISNYSASVRLFQNWNLCHCDKSISSENRFRLQKFYKFLFQIAKNILLNDEIQF